MPKLKNQYPKMYRDKNSAVSKHKGQRIYHGVWGLPEADKAYKRFIPMVEESAKCCVPVRSTCSAEPPADATCPHCINYAESPIL